MIKGRIPLSEAYLFFTYVTSRYVASLVLMEAFCKWA